MPTGETKTRQRSTMAILRNAALWVGLPLALAFMWWLGTPASPLESLAAICVFFGLVLAAYGIAKLGSLGDIFDDVHPGARMARIADVERRGKPPAAPARLGLMRIAAGLGYVVLGVLLILLGG